MNLPNKLTIFRVLLIPFFVISLYVNVLTGADIWRYIALVIFAVASLTDLADGKIARKYNLVTNFGKFMDPLADKLLVSAALICFIEMGLLPAWFVLIIISREFIISGFRLVAADDGIVIAASMWGKVKTTFQMIMIVLLLLPGKWLIGTMDLLFVVRELVKWIALILTIISLVDYIIQNKNIMADGEM